MDTTAGAAGWTELFDEGELGASPRLVRCGDRSIVIWRTASGRYGALDNSCPHQGTELTSASVSGESLRCSRHGWEVGTDGWCDRAASGTPAHRIKVADGRLWIRVR